MTFKLECGPCKGQGFYYPFPADICVVCGGHGEMEIPGDPSDYDWCKICGGKGFRYPYPRETCKVCGGTRVVSKNRIKTVSPPGLDAPRVPPRESAEQCFDNIEETLDHSSIEQPLREIALYDLHQASIAYESKAYKACIVLLGAVLEGIMLGTLRRKDVILAMRNDPDPPIVIRRLGLSDPQLGQKIAERLRFEDYKNAVKHLIPELEKEKAEAIQEFRNTVHPWKAIQEPSLYAEPDQTRSLNLLTALAIIVRHIAAWKP